MCKYHYKFCKTYKDGKQICRYAEENPWTEDMSEQNFYTPEEQDFLPPPKYDENLTDDEWSGIVDNFGQFILPLAHGQGRAESEPVCYSTACKQDHPNLSRGDTTVEGKQNKTVEEARIDVDELKLTVRELEMDIQQYEIDKPTWKNNLRVAEGDFEDAEEDFEDAVTNYRHAMDVKVRNQDDIDMQKTARLDYDIEKLNFAKATIDLKTYQDEYDDNFEKYYTAIYDLGVANTDFKDALDSLVDAKVKNRLTIRGDNKFVNIILSKTCLQMINNDIPTQCPTYTELHELFDNTIPRVSGEFIETEFDIKRVPSKYDDYWMYYKALPEWKILTVDPDINIMNRGINITILPNSFDYLEKSKSQSKTDSIDTDTSERYVWHDVYYDTYCSEVSVAPDTQLITDIINNIWDKCDTTVEPEVFNLELYPLIPWIDSPFHQYTVWLNDVLEKCKTEC